ncbi:proton-coupled folate transporter-like [Trichoplusia ni]|uniref:Proton-coupled folate transporter-like n=1 Tax=Trichoplusia ni TaxID=7111 RepID=A0A7E5VMC6_TRINI|nr:proton-coupled folate transporter-like [Trichoplusia ni]XP_026729450.1 proton-coupled folate transporter-like [Trichoplusia ni]
MAQDDERLSENNEAVNTISEIPAKRFGLTMEFPTFIIMMGMSLAGTAISNIILYRTCVHSLHYPEDECRLFLSIDKKNTTNHLEGEVQKYATLVSTVRGVIEALVPAFLSFFLGVWSDSHGRKPLIVWPIFGITISSGMMVVYSLMNSLGPWWYILAVIPYSLCGGFTIMFTGAFCYLSDITTTKNRSIRMIMLEVAVGCGSVVGSLLSPYALRVFGNVYLLLIVTTLNVIAYVFTNVYLRESLTGALQGGLTTVLDFLLVKEMVRECFKRRPNNGRSQILLLIIANSLSIFILYGTVSLEYMFTRAKLHWTMKDFTQFSGLSTLISFIGSGFVIVVLHRLLKISDLAISNLAYISVIAEFLIRTFATASWHMYLGASIASFKGLSAPLIRAFLTKILPVVDIAKVFALMSAVEGLCPLLSPLIYNSLYQVTLDVFPGAIYLLSAAITATSVVCVTMVQYYRWNVSSPYQPLSA